MSTGQCLKTLVADLSGAAANVPIAYVTFSPSSEQLLACTLDETVRLWDVMNGKVMKTYTGHSNLKYATKAAFTYPRFIEPGPATEADIHFPEKAELTPEERHEITQKLLSRERRRRDRKGLPEVLIAIGSENQKVYLWDLQTKEIVQELEGHRDVILGLAVSRPALMFEFLFAVLTSHVFISGSSLSAHHCVWQHGQRSQHSHLARRWLGGIFTVDFRNV